MERYIVSARKYRPQTFESVVGQSHITSTLENAIKNNHLAQALLFCGPRGVGKTTCARILAKKINESTSTGEEDYAFNIFELDAASNNSVEDIRRLIDQVRFAPQVGKYKAYIIDEVHMLSQSAFNAFLKTLEEPPAHAIFILATTEKHKIIPTILSRCQIFDFKRITVEDIANHLAYVAKQEGITADPEGLHLIAQKADGALRDALSIFDRLVSFNGAEITYQSVLDNLDILDYDYYFKATDLILQQDLTNLLLLFDEIIDKGFEGIQFVNGLATHLRDLMVSLDPQTVSLLEVGPNQKARYLEQSKRCDLKMIFGALSALNDCDNRYKSSNNQRLLVEVTLMGLTQLTEKKKSDVNQDAVRAQPRTASPPQPTPEQIITVDPQVVPTKKQPSALTAPTQENTEQEVTAPDPTNASKAEAEEVVSQPQVSTPETEASDSKPTQTDGKPDWLVKLSGKSTIRINTDPQTKENVTSAIEETTHEPQINGPKEVFSDAAFNEAWKEFLESIHGLKTIHAMLTARPPQLKNLTEVHFNLENNTQANYLQGIQTEMAVFLREKLNNFNISIHVNVSELVTEKRPYTAEERYLAMVEINPHLDALRKLLDTDID